MRTGSPPNVVIHETKEVIFLIESGMAYMGISTFLENLGFDAKNLPAKLFQQNEEDLGRLTAKIDNPFKLSGGIDEDILKGLGSNPTTEDLQSALIRQDLRSYGKTG